MTTATTFHEVPPGTRMLACECGSAVPATERDRAAHERYHAERDRAVIELAHEEAVRVVELRAS